MTIKSRPALLMGMYEDKEILVIKPRWTHFFSRKLFANPEGYKLALLNRIFALAAIGFLILGLPPLGAFKVITLIFFGLSLLGWGLTCMVSPFREWLYGDIFSGAYALSPKAKVKEIQYGEEGPNGRVIIYFVNPIDKIFNIGQAAYHDFIGDIGRWRDDPRKETTANLETARKEALKRIQRTTALYAEEAVKKANLRIVKDVEITDEPKQD